jgi:hypothetical protein
MEEEHLLCETIINATFSFLYSVHLVKNLNFINVGQSQ